MGLNSGFKGLRHSIFRPFCCPLGVRYWSGHTTRPTLPTPLVKPRFGRFFLLLHYSDDRTYMVSYEWALGIAHCLRVRSSTTYFHLQSDDVAFSVTATFETLDNMQPLLRPFCLHLR